MPVERRSADRTAAPPTAAPPMISGAQAALSPAASRPAPSRLSARLSCRIPSPHSDSQTCQLVITKRILDPIADTGPVGRDHVEAAWWHTARAPITAPKVLREIVVRGAHQALALERINASACAAECIAASKS